MGKLNSRAWIRIAKLTEWAAKAVRRRKGGTFVPELSGPRAYRRRSGLGAHLPWIRGLYGAAGKRSPPMSAGPLDGNLEFLLLQHPMPRAAGSPTGRFLYKREQPQWRLSGDDAVSGHCFVAAAKSTAGVRTGDGSPAHAAASESAAQAGAARCEAVRHNCCNDPEARSPRAASGRAPDNPDSNTAPSNPADIAFVCLANPRPRRRREKRCRRSTPTAKAPRTGGIVLRRL